MLIKVKIYVSHNQKVRDSSTCKPSRKCNVNITRPNCDEIRIFGNCTKSTTSISSSVRLRVSLIGFGNTDVDSQTFPVAGNFDFTVNTSTYPNFNNSTSDPVNLFFKVEAAAECGDTDAAQISFKPLDGMCDYEDKATIWDWKERTSQAISFRTNHHKGWFHGYEQTKIYSYWKDGTTWKNNNSRLKAKIVSKRQNAVCSLEDGEQETKSCDHCKSIQASVNSPFWWFCDDDVVGTLEKKYTWQGNTSTIDAVQSVDFDCCE